MKPSANLGTLRPLNPNNSTQRTPPFSGARFTVLPVKGTAEDISHPRQHGTRNSSVFDGRRTRMEERWEGWEKPAINTDERRYDRNKQRFDSSTLFCSGLSESTTPFSRRFGLSPDSSSLPRRWKIGPSQRKTHDHAHLPRLHTYRNIQNRTRFKIPMNLMHFHR